MDQQENMERPLIWARKKLQLLEQPGLQPTGSTFQVATPEQSYLKHLLQVLSPTAHTPLSHLLLIAATAYYGSLGPAPEC